MISYNDIIIMRKILLEREMKYRPLRELKDNISNIKVRADFKKALQNKSDISLICEYKPASPSKGDISDILVEDIVPIYEKGGSSAISILTEECFFKSNIKNLRIASKATKLPLLRKDFVLDEYQIFEARSCGASAVLLMVDLYKDLQDGIELCKYLDMVALVECKNREEIEKAVQSGAEIIGINNRNFNDFSIDLKRTQKLAECVPENTILVSESGVNTGEDIKLLGSYGADAVLVGSSIMGSSDIPNKVNELYEASKGARLS
ncbi:indole-3-glycerol phosphate synthase TrpC [Methanobacterium sp. ACI-7]|uniref:indole-3-glycerol phosphate synthase TrpC n=1 Tax=unclassified Methanobacterium TaxID=2627676 RepID=UPI0039C10C54